MADAGALGRAGAIALLLCSVLLWSRSRRADARRGRACAVAALFVALGIHGMGAQLERADAARIEAPRDALLEGRVARVASRPGGLALELHRVRAVSGDPLPARLRLSAPAGSIRERLLLPGDQLRLRARLRPAEGRVNPGRPDPARRWARAGIGGLGHVVHPELVARLPQREGFRLLASLHGFRSRAALRLRQRGAGGGLLAALALGDRGALPAEVREGCRKLGISHLLAVSGLHLALLAVMALRIALPLCARVSRTDPRGAALVAALGAAAVYALLAGFGVPVRRALILLIALAASRSAGRSVHWSAPLAGAALWILGREPQALFDPGAQLSFAACAGLAGSTRPGPRGARGVRGMLFSSATALAATAPVAAGAFGSVAPWGWASNAVAIPWTALLLLPVALAAALWAGLAPAGGGVPLDLAAALGSASVAAVVWLSERLPLLAATEPAPSALLAGVLAALGTMRLRSLRGRLLASAAIATGLALAPAASDPGPLPRAVFLDVGQGDATVIQGRRGTLLVDAGRAFPAGDVGRSVVLPALRSLGVTRLDALALSHADLDHRGGAVSVLRAIPVDELWLPGGGLAEPAFAEAVAAAHERGVSVRERARGATPVWLGDLRVATLWPPARGGPSSRNDRSLVLRVEVDGLRLLLPGDLEADAEAALLQSPGALRAHVLKLAHHGSRTSSTPDFLAAVGPDVAVASAPRFGRFEMPHAEVRDRLRRAGSALWWTGRDGAVGVALGRRLWVRGWRQPPSRRRAAMPLRASRR